MNLFKRVSATITSSVDRAVSRVENHDAIINAALKDSQRAAARSRVRLQRVRKDGQSLKERYREFETAAKNWADRARSVAAEDEAKALECLRRRRECESRLAGLRDSIQQHDELESRIGEQVKEIELRIGEVTQQRNIMRSRQSVAEAMHVMHNIQGSSASDIEDTFDRWEINLGASEVLLGACSSTDTLEASFMEQEEAAELKAELDELLRADEEQQS